MRASIPLLWLALFAAACGMPSPQDATQQTRPDMSPAGALTIERAWAAPTPAGVDVSAGYLTIANGAPAEDRLLIVTSPRAARVEIHEMSMDGAVMRMRAVEDLAVPAGEDVTFGPGGLHLMFYGVTQPFAEGETIPVQLTFATAGVVDIVLPVRQSAPVDHGVH